MAEHSTKPRISKLSAMRSARRARRLADLAKARESAQHDPRSGRPYKSLAELLNRIAVMPSGCWEWQGARNQYGYGILHVRIAGKLTIIGAHKLQWNRVKGLVPDGLHVLHTCDNRRCINPEHLWLGTPKDNIHDMIAKGRANFQGLKNVGTLLGTE